MKGFCQFDHPIYYLGDLAHTHWLSRLLAVRSAPWEAAVRPSQAWPSAPLLRLSTHPGGAGTVGQGGATCDPAVVQLVDGVLLVAPSHDYETRPRLQRPICGGTPDRSGGTLTWVSHLLRATSGPRYESLTRAQPRRLDAGKEADVALLLWCRVRVQTYPSIQVQACLTSPIYLAAISPPERTQATGAE